MGGGAWSHDDFTVYLRRSSRSVREDGSVDMSGISGAQELFKSRSIHKDLNPKNIVRECT